jgi:hypothetical protein
MPLFEDNWLWRGFQSAVFLYVSCGPCYSAAYKRKRKKDAKRDKKENQKMAHIHAELGHTAQPAPFEVNTYWREEIALGPHGVRKEQKKKPEKRDITTASTTSTTGSSLDEVSRAGSATSGPNNVSWNSRRYQRADEEFTYLPDLEEVAGDRDHLTVPGTSGRGIAEGAQPVHGIQKPKKAYWEPVHAPSINELHPPSTSRLPARKSERSWMTQPPPSAAFMEGKKPPTVVSRRSTVSSKSTRRATASSGTPSFGNHVGHSAVEDSRKSGSSSRIGAREAELRFGGSGGLSRTASASPRRHNSGSLEKRRNTPRKARKRPVALRINSSSSGSDSETAPVFDSDTGEKGMRAYRRSIISNQLKLSTPVLGPLQTRQPNLPRRPQLTATRSSDSPVPRSHSSINNEDENILTSRSPSSASLSPQSSISTEQLRSPRTRSPLKIKRVTNNYTPSPRKRKDTITDIVANGTPRLFIKDSSLHLLQDLVEPSSLLNSRFIRSPTVEAKIPLPKDSADGYENFWLASHVDEEIAWVAPTKRWSTGEIDFDSERRDGFQ